MPVTTVEIGPATDPAGRRCVLVQLEHGFVLLQPLDALLIAARINSVANSIRGSLFGEELIAEWEASAE